MTTNMLSFFNAVFNTNIDLNKSSDDVLATVKHIVQRYIIDWCDDLGLPHVLIPAEDVMQIIINE